MLAKLDKTTSRSLTDLPIIIVGNGPVGIRVANLLLKKNPQAKLIIFGEEASKPYNRVQLSYFLSGKVQQQQLANPLIYDKSAQVDEYIGRRVIDIDRVNKTITDNLGNLFAYSKLILSLGSKPFIPNIANTQLTGVHLFRTIDDAKKLCIDKKNCKNFHVVGSGPLGLETAIALKSASNEVFIHVRNNIFSSQFDAAAQLVLADYLAALQIKTIQQNPIKHLQGIDQVNAVELTDGEIIPADCVIFCSGVLPNIELAKQVGLKTNRGIIIDRYALTSDADIYAIGECSEYNHKIYGLVKPGLKQAYACAEHLTGSHQTIIEEEIPNIQVKLGQLSSAAYGSFGSDEYQYLEYSNRLKGIFRKIALHQGCIVGAIIVGRWSEEGDVENLIKARTKLKSKVLKNFLQNGSLKGSKLESSIKNQAEDYLVCLCNNVTKGEICSAIQSGCRTVELLGENTYAGVVCGSCKPLLSELLDTPAPNLVMRHQKEILIASIISLLLIAITFVFEPLDIAASVQFEWHIEKLWFDNFWKQVSGYTLLGLCLVASALALRKRWKKLTQGHLDSWRYFHSVVGIIALLVLLIHTGVRLGNNLNFALMMTFLAATLTGSLVGVSMAKNHHWSDLKLRKHRVWWSRVHHTLLWMLPPLIGFHILSVYYF